MHAESVFRLTLATTRLFNINQRGPVSLLTVFPAQSTSQPSKFGLQANMDLTKLNQLLERRSPPLNAFIFAQLSQLSLTG